jgi:hypothetical protein
MSAGGKPEKNRDACRRVASQEGTAMHTGGLMAARQVLGQYLVYAKPWQRRLVVAGVIAGGALLITAGIATGHVVPAVIGGLELLAVGNGCVQVLRARRGRREPAPEDGTASTVPGG